jgi:L-ascorbate metabolism protein UlaG (beta-lactamase superfamily)
MQLRKMTYLLMAFTTSLTAIDSFAGGAVNAQPDADKSTVQLQEIRNATVKITYADTTFLIDPMLSKKGTYPGFKNTYRSELRNPLVELPMSEDDVLNGVDAVIVTHTHLDHWDDAAQKLIPKTTPLFVQHQSDADIIRRQGFKNVRILDDRTEFGGVTLSKIGGQHGTDKMYTTPMIAQLLGEAMGVVFQSPQHKTLYLAGDTIWRPEVDQALEQFKPEIIVLNAGYARISGFDNSIIMGKNDVLKASKLMPKSKVVAVHMDAINHMSLTRKELKQFVHANSIDSHVDIPQDGESLKF